MSGGSIKTTVVTIMGGHPLMCTMKDITLCMHTARMFLDISVCVMIGVEQLLYERPGGIWRQCKTSLRRHRPVMQRNSSSTVAGKGSCPDRLSSSCHAACSHAARITHMNQGLEAYLLHEHSSMTVQCLASSICCSAGMIDGHQLR